jgi:hypothetical protein
LIRIAEPYKCASDIYPIWMILPPDRGQYAEHLSIRIVINKNYNYSVKI